MAIKVTSTTGQQTSYAQVDAVVIRCGCGDPDSHRGLVCPKPRKTEDLGTIAYHHKSLWQRLRYKLLRLFNPTARI